MFDLEWASDYSSESILEKDSLTAQESLYLGKTRSYAREVGLEEMQQCIEDRMVEYLESSPEALRTGSLKEEDIPLDAREIFDIVGERRRRLVHADMSAYDTSREDAEDMVREINSAYLNRFIGSEGLEFEEEPLVPKELAAE